MVKEFKRKKDIVLMAMRCEFIIGSFKMTKKGMGTFSHRQWRFINNVKSFFSPKWHNDMVSFLRNIEGGEIIDKVFVDDYNKQ